MKGRLFGGKLADTDVAVAASCPGTAAVMWFPAIGLQKS